MPMFLHILSNENSRLQDDGRVIPKTPLSQLSSRIPTFLPSRKPTSGAHQQAGQTS